MKLHHLALFGALAPLVLIGGCSGGSGTSLVTPTAPTDAGTVLPASAFRLPGGQVAILTLARNRTALAGTLRVIGDVVFSPSLSAGVYPVTGNFADPGGFSLTGRAADAGDFSISGTLPDQNTDGSYNFTIGGVSQTGVLSAQGLASVPLATSYSAFGNLNFSNFQARGPLNQLSDYPFDLVTVAASGAGAFNALPSNSTNDGGFQYIVGGDSIAQSLKVTGTRTNPANRRQNLRIEVEINPLVTAGQSRLLSPGQTFDLTVPARTVAGSTNYLPNVSVTLGGFRYDNIAGTLAIKSLGSEAVTLELRDVRVANNSSFPVPPSGDISGFPDDGQPISSFVVNGTIEAGGLQSRVINR